MECCPFCSHLASQGLSLLDTWRRKFHCLPSYLCASWILLRAQPLVELSTNGSSPYCWAAVVFSFSLLEPSATRPGRDRQIPFHMTAWEYLTTVPCCLLSSSISCLLDNFMSRLFCVCSCLWTHSSLLLLSFSIS